MIPSNPSLVTDYSFYRDQNMYRCPIEGCSQSFGAPEALQIHIRAGHIFQRPPDGAMSPSIASSTNNYFNSTSTVRRPSQPEHYGSCLAYPPPRNRQTLPPISAISSITNTASQVPRQSSSWVETTNWPETTVNFLKKLVHTHALYTKPITPEDNRKLYCIYDEFYEKTDFRTYKPPKFDERLWQLFNVKLEQIQYAMMQQGEILKTPDGRILPMRPCSTRINTPETLATPPATPVQGSDKDSDGMEVWNWLDADAQALLFRQQLRSAKNLRGLMLEWNEYCGDKGEKCVTKPRDPRSVTPSTQSPGPKPLPVPPVPRSTGTIDVKEIIARKLQELQGKKDSDLLRASEEHLSKRPKTDST
ncbi:uncharacterized protein RSE6_06866 [Rhynchosporium secalis]|uniref:C2H2-type domain-containing protein n=1 Tax=Rhynchosporium secalis TaxID=38038 RepID=A0A1E1MBH9_RHYSE|nr:uncharacterized protein RSE6_06866 [Rhynchosporium secalis]